MSTFEYAVEKIGESVHILATGDGTLWDRLSSARNYFIIPADDVPLDLKETYEELAPLVRSVSPTSPDELRRIADRMVAFCFRMYRESGMQSPRM